MGNCCSCFGRKNGSESALGDDVSGSNNQTRSSSSGQDQQQNSHQQVSAANNEPSEVVETAVAATSSRGKHHSLSSTSSSSSSLREECQVVRDPSAIPPHADVPSAVRMVHSMSLREDGSNPEVDARSQVSSSRFHDRSSSSSDSSKSEKSDSTRGPLTVSVMKNVAESRINSLEHSSPNAEVVRVLNMDSKSGSDSNRSGNEEKVPKPALSAGSSTEQLHYPSSRASSRVSSSASNSSTSSSAAEMRGSKSSSSYQRNVDANDNADVFPKRNIESSNVERSSGSSSSRSKSSSCSSQKEPKSRNESGSILNDGSVRVVESSDIDGHDKAAATNSSSRSSSDVIVEYDGKKESIAQSSADIRLEESDKENVAPAFSSNSGSSSSSKPPETMKKGLQMADRNVPNIAKPVQKVHVPIRTSLDSCEFHSANSGRGEGYESSEVASSSSSDGPNSSEQTSVMTRPSEVASSAVQTSDGTSSATSTSPSERASSSVTSRPTDAASSVHPIDSSMPTESHTSRSFSTKPSTRTSVSKSTEQSYNRESSYATSTTRATSYNSSDATEHGDLL